MNRDQSSLDLYIKMVKEFSGNNPFKTKTPEVEDIKALFDVMKEELVVAGYSHLVDAAYSSCCHFCACNRLPLKYYSSSNYYLSEPNKKNLIFPFAAWWLLIYLAKYMSGGKFCNDVGSETLQHFFRNCRPQNANFKDVLDALRNIDTEIIVLRKKMYDASICDKNGKNSDSQLETLPDDNAFVKENSNKDNVDDIIGVESASDQVIKEFIRKKIEEEKVSIIDSARKEAEAEKALIINNARQQIEEERRALIDSTHRQLEEEKNSLIDSANQQAEKILSRAIVAADKRLAEAKKRVVSVCADERLKACTAEQDGISSCFDAVREVLLDTNEAVKRLEDAVSKKTTEKVYAQFFELYNLIADSKDSAFELSRQNNDVDLENAAYNMEVFMDMIVEYLADFGIETIVSMPGDVFSGKYHALSTNDVEFDPRSAVIKKSLRNGFVWGEQVLQKERVSISGEN